MQDHELKLLIEQLATKASLADASNPEISQGLDTVEELLAHGEELPVGVIKLLQDIVADIPSGMFAGNYTRMLNILGQIGATIPAGPDDDEDDLIDD